jgi:Skp family chaperone for outer membrane proteins
MFKLKKFYSIIICFFLFSTNSFSDNKIAYIDIDMILSQSEPSKLLFSQLKKIEEKKLKKLKNDEINLKEEENKILSTKNIISNEEYNKSVSNFKNKLNKYKKTKNKVIQDLKQKRNNEVLRFFKLINPLIEKVMDEKSIKIIIEKKNIFIAKSNYDITPTVIEKINENIKEFLIEE